MFNTCIIITVLLSHLSVQAKGFVSTLFFRRNSNRSKIDLYIRKIYIYWTVCTSMYCYCYFMLFLYCHRVRSYHITMCLSLVNVLLLALQLMWNTAKPVFRWGSLEVLHLILLRPQNNWSPFVLLCGQIIGLLNVFTPQKTQEEFQDVWVFVLCCSFPWVVGFHAYTCDFKCEMLSP